jgi:hypothetical protein
MRPPGGTRASLGYQKVRTQYKVSLFTRYHYGATDQLRKALGVILQHESRASARDIRTKSKTS